MLCFKIRVDIEREVYQGITRAFLDRFPRRPARWSGRDNPETKPLEKPISSGSEQSVDSVLRSAAERNDINSNNNNDNNNENESK